MAFLDSAYSVLLVSSSEKLNTALLALLPSSDYYPVAVVRSVSAARRELLERDWDLVLINSPLPDDGGLELAMDVCHRSAAGVLLLTPGAVYEDVYYRVLADGVVTLPKPTGTQLLRQTLRRLCAMRERLRAVSRQQATVEQRIEEIRLINRAKWLLVERRGMTEPEAHRYIEKQAMDRRLTRRQVAEELLET